MFGKVKSIAEGVANKVLPTEELNKLGGKVFGGSQEAGVLGTGQYRPEASQINEKAFQQTEALKQRQAQMQAQLAAVQNRQIPAAQINMAPQDQFRNAQMGLLSQLQAQSMGQGPSLAQMQLQQGADRNLANAIAMQASQRGGAAGGLGLRNIQQQRAMIGQDLAAQAGMQRLQEQQAAQGALGQLAGSGRAQDIGLATQQAQFQQEAALQGAALNDAMARFYGQGLTDLGAQQQAAQMELERLKASQALGLEGLTQKGYESAGKARGDLIGGLGQGISSLATMGGPAAAMSDKRVKKNISKDTSELDDFLTGLSQGGVVGGKAKMQGDHPSNDTVLAKLSPKEIVVPRSVAIPTLKGDDEKLQEFIDGLRSYTYNYKDEKHGGGKYASPMAQDLEKSELGKSMIVETPEGKMVDYSRAAGTMLATAAMLNDKLKGLESKVDGYASGGVVEDKKNKLAMSMKSAFKTPEPKEDKEEKSLYGSEWYQDKINKARGYASGGIVEDPLTVSMKLAFNALEKKPEPQSRPDYHPSDAEKKFTDSMKKAFRGK